MLPVACKVFYFLFSYFWLGWRVSMEDSHIADLELGNKRAIFGVFDGHGGFHHISDYSKNF